mmetsp:Transcript_35056/g.34736  ORF Transcript_35056/g.34736 Transcript_35056/m.34736 type:complete len:370 (-) Transcript_35056:30-1139(-)
MSSHKDLVVVTGASGYLGSWIVVKLLNSGKYKVRGTVREHDNAEKMDPLKKAIEENCKDNYEDLEFASASLGDFVSIKLALKGAKYVIHVASPMPGSNTKDRENTLIKPAIEGNLNVLKACIDSTVEKVVITSSGLTVCDHAAGDGTYGPDTFVEEHKDLDDYSKSKIRAEAAAKEFMEDLGEDQRDFDVMFMHPGGISGAAIVPQRKGDTIELFCNILEGKVSGVPQVYYPMVDVEDTAEAHIKALEKGVHLGRYPLCSDTIKMVEIAKTVKKNYEEIMGHKIPDKEIGKCMVWIGSWFKSDVKNIYYHWNINARLDGTYAKEELGLKDYKTIEQSIVETCEFLIKNKLCKQPKKPKDTEDSKEEAKE